MFMAICHIIYYSCSKDFWTGFPNKSQQELEHCQVTSPPVKHTPPAFKVGMASSSQQFFVQHTTLSQQHSSTQSPSVHINHTPQVAIRSGHIHVCTKHIMYIHVHVCRVLYTCMYMYITTASIYMYIIIHKTP